MELRETDPAPALAEVAAPVVLAVPPVAGELVEESTLVEPPESIETTGPKE